MNENRKRKRIRIAILSLLVLIMLIILGVSWLSSKDLAFLNKQKNKQASGKISTQIHSNVSDYSSVIKKADLLAKGYDFDRAISLIKDVKGYEDNYHLASALTRYEKEKAQMVRWQDITKIPHVFFHTLIADNQKAFDGDNRQDGYNAYMTTIEEFKKIIQQMYDRGYVLVSIHDIGHLEKQKDGSEKMVPGDIWLPKGKKPFVLSQDDVSYYEYMEGDGFAKRLILNKKGNLTNEMELEDGSIVTGSYDVAPLLEDFIDEHPDFSYRGAKGIIALTGYNGVLGYRTSPSEYTNSPTLKEDREKARNVALAMKKQGWEFASHSWGHINDGSATYQTFVKDTDKWEEEVESIIGKTDIYLFPFGSDIGSWHPYQGQRYEYLKNKGFTYFCNVDASKPSWVQLTDEYLRQGRINIDGIRMYEDLYKGKNTLSTLFDVKSAFDEERPLPVPGA
ncbi:polysaccharide deacetylase family protein [Priestia aryabhattai]|uniref:polysaccharide deacetylase family protein n=1 Tax=Priestia aryabhattai TaxID=412384 RepID=UPI0036C7205B